MSSRSVEVLKSRKTAIINSVGDLEERKDYHTKNLVRIETDLVEAQALLTDIDESIEVLENAQKVKDLN